MFIFKATLFLSNYQRHQRLIVQSVTLVAVKQWFDVLIGHLEEAELMMFYHTRMSHI